MGRKRGIWTIERLSLRKFGFSLDVIAEKTFFYKKISKNSSVFVNGMIYYRSSFCSVICGSLFQINIFQIYTIQVIAKYVLKHKEDFYYGNRYSKMV